MNLFNQIKRLFFARKVTENKSLITRRFIIAISAIYCVLILASSVSLHYSMTTSSRLLTDTLFSYNQEILTEKIGALIERLRNKKASSIEEIRNEIRDYSASSGDILYVIMFSKTDDENYYRIYHMIQIKNDFELNLSKNAIVKENKAINYLKQGLAHNVMDPDLYSQDNYHWQNIYSPYEIKGRKLVLQFLVSAARAREAIRNYGESIKNIRVLNIIVTVALAIAVIILTVIFVQNYSLLITNLSGFMQKAASGDLDVSLNPTADGELTQLAQSFNTLIEELKDKTDKRAPETEGTDALFGTGVKNLKENRLDDAIVIFKTLTVIKPKGFSSYFNLGVAYAKKREYADALAAFERALQIDPSHEITGAYSQKVRGLMDHHA